MTDVPRTLAARHAAEEEARRQRLARIHHDHQQRKADDPPQGYQRPASTEDRHDERRPPLHEVIDVENAHDGTYHGERRQRVITRQNQRDRISA